MKSHLVNPERPRRGAGVEVMWRYLPFNNFHFSKVSGMFKWSNVQMFKCSNDVIKLWSQLGIVLTHPTIALLLSSGGGVPVWRFLQSNGLLPPRRITLVTSKISSHGQAHTEVLTGPGMFDWDSPGRLSTLAPWASLGSAICEQNISENLRRF